MLNADEQNKLWSKDEVPGVLDEVILKTLYWVVIGGGGHHPRGTTGSVRFLARIHWGNRTRIYRKLHN